jgi:hypothetical protein
MAIVMLKDTGCAHEALIKAPSSWGSTPFLWGVPRTTVAAIPVRTATSQPVPTWRLAPLPTN